MASPEVGEQFGRRSDRREAQHGAVRRDRGVEPAGHPLVVALRRTGCRRNFSWLFFLVRFVAMRLRDGRTWIIRALIPTEFSRARLRAQLRRRRV